MPPDTEADSLCECVGHDIYLEGACLAFKNGLACSATMKRINQADNVICPAC
jgi:hypothetical protein